MQSQCPSAGQRVALVTAVLEPTYAAPHRPGATRRASSDLDTLRNRNGSGVTTGARFTFGPGAVGVLRIASERAGHTILWARLALSPGAREPGCEPGSLSRGDRRRARPPCGEASLGLERGEHDGRHGIEAGSSQTLQKPFSIDALTTKIREVLTPIS